MEEAEVKQLISLIESAQLQYEVDESGTVSIVCDPVQLVESASIDATETNVDISTDNLLTRHIEATVTSGEENRNHGTNTTILESRREDGERLEEILEKKTEEETKIETSQQIKSEDIIQQTSSTASPVHYFLQTPTGQIIQVLESLEGVSEGPEGEVQALEVIADEENLAFNTDGNADENMQIFVVGSSDGGDMFLINAADGQMTEESGNSIDVSQVMLKNSEVEDNESIQINKETEEIAPLTSDRGNKSTEQHAGVFVGVGAEENDQNLRKTSEIPTKTLSPEARSFFENKKGTFPKGRTVDNRTLGNKQYMKLNLQKEPTLPLRGTCNVDGSPNTVVEGSVIQTEKGEMVAFDVNSLREEEICGKKTTLQNLGSSFATWVKVLRPAGQEKAVNPDSMAKRFNVFSCEDCGGILHTERSLRTHRRRFHEEWNDECFICGEKFFNLHYVRSHIREVHNNEKSFECRYCSFKCFLLKEFYKHFRVHKKSQGCSNCGKKYTSPKLYQDHVANCKSNRGTELKCNDVDCSIQMKMPTKGPDKKEDGFLPYQNTLIVTQNKKRTRKFPPNRKRDAEFRIESKHYSQQIKKMALEQPPRNANRGRYRTHRCYLCFKLFKNAADLEGHKEVYHQAKSSQPVRVKTDESLGKDEEEMLDMPCVKTYRYSFGENLSEEVLIKPEPPDLTEHVENVTIILDEAMNLYQVMKPLCIACKSYTKTDFRQSCKFFQKNSNCDQFEALKKFEKFFPCAIESDSMLGPWVLCKKCSVLIDKITEMEEKLTTMKSNLFLLHLQGSMKAVSENTKENCVVESAVKKEYNDMNKCNKGTLNSDQVSEDSIKNFVEIEANAKRKLEILEVSQPPKKHCGPRKHEVVDLSPVLGSDDEHEEFTISDSIKVGSRKDENVVIEGDTNTERNVKIGIIKEETLEDEGDELCEIQNTNIKTEPLQSDYDSIVPNTNPLSWEDDHLQEEEFLLTSSKPKKDKKLDSDLLPSQLLADGVNSESSQNRLVKKSQLDSFEKCDIGSEDVPAGSKGVAQSSEHPHSPSSSQKALNKMKVKEDDNDSVPSVTRIQEVLKDLETKNGNENLTNKDSEENNTSGTSPDELITMEEEKDKKPRCESLWNTGVKKRAKIRQERNLMSYRLEGNAAKPWVCSNCHKGFSTQRGACDHYAASHGGQSYSCEHCSASYVRKRDLIGHYNRVHFKTTPYKCKQCSKSFSMHSQLYRHVQNAHTDEKKDPTYYNCHLCDASFTQKRYRDAHVTVCLTKGSNSTPFSCHKCDKAFKLQKYLRVHMRTAHSEKSDSYLCEICNKVLNDKRNLVLHMKSHAGVTKASCNICMKQFSRKSYLWTHMRVHTDERPYGCNYCSKWFKQYSTWKNHERTHTGEKPYICTVCHSCFATSSSVSKHLQYAHLNIRDFGCAICKKNFISKAKLEEHMKTHTGEKPYECPVCNRAFNKKTNLRTHMYIHSTNKRFKCELCGEGFMRRSAIEVHFLDRHSDLNFMLGTNMPSGDKGKAGGGVAAATSPFISVVGAEEVTAEDTYIVVYADEKEAETSKDMEVTVLAEEEAQNTQVETASNHLSLSFEQNEIKSALSTNALPKVIIKEHNSVEGSEVLPTLITTEDDVASTISMHETPSQFRLHTSEVDSGPVYPV